jgi:hypothetical protein
MASAVNEMLAERQAASNGKESLRGTEKMAERL